MLCSHDLTSTSHDLLESDGESIALRVEEVRYQVGSMIAMATQQILRLLTREAIKHIPTECNHKDKV